MSWGPQAGSPRALALRVILSCHLNGAVAWAPGVQLPALGALGAAGAFGRLLTPCVWDITPGGLAFCLRLPRLATFPAGVGLGHFVVARDARGTQVLERPSLLQVTEVVMIYDAEKQRPRGKRDGVCP